MSGAMIRVLLACAEAELHERMTAVLAETGVAELASGVYDTHGLFAAVERDELNEVEVVLIDEGIGPAPAMQAIRELLAMKPFVGVVVLTRESTPEVLAAAMDAGARSTLTVPASVDEMRSRIESAAGWSRSLLAHLTGESMTSGRRGDVLAVTGAKGGAGTTVLATLLARELGRGGATSVCLVDLDLRGGAVAFYADVDPRRDVADLADVAQELTGRSIREVVLTHPSGLSVLAAPGEPERAEDLSAPAVRQIIAQLRTQYERVVIDCGSQLDEVTAAALELADTVLLVTLPDVVSLRAARRVLDSWERLNVRARSDVGVVLNRASRNVEVQGDLAEQIVSASVVGTVPADFKQLEPLVNTGTLLQARNTSIPRAVAALVESVPALASVRERPRPEQAPRRRVARPPVLRGAASEAGQVLVETPVVIMLFLTIAAMCVQGLLFGISHLVAGHAAAEAARVAAVSSNGAEIKAAAVDSLPSGWVTGAVVGIGPGDITVQVSTPSLAPEMGILNVVRSAAVLEEEAW